MKKTCLLPTLACLAAAVVPAGVHAQELIKNGNFEDGTLAGWQVSAPAGTTVSTVNESSPFRSRYPAGTRGARLQDDDVEFETPNFGQAFTPQTGLQISFDFKASATEPGSSWYVIWKGDADTTAFFFTIGGQDGASLELNQATIGSIETGSWYHVEGTAYASAQSITGSVTDSRGVRTTFTSGFPFGALSSLSAVSITDGDQARNGTLLIDNISASAAVLPSASLNVALTPDQKISVSWNVAGYSLQGSSTIGSGAQWIAIQTTGQSFTAPVDQPLQFFRLVAN